MTTRYPTRTLLALLTLSLSGLATAATLPEVVAKALSEHPSVRASQFQANAAEQQVSVSRSGFFPVLGLSAQRADSKDTQYGTPIERESQRADAYLRWNLFKGFTDYHSLRVAQHDRDAAGAELSDMRERVALQVSQIYLDVYRLRRQYELGEAYLREHRELNAGIRKRAEAGRISPADVELTEVGLIQTEAQQAMLKAQLDAAELRYKLMMGVMPTDLSAPKLDDMPLALGRDAALNALAQENYRVLAANRRAEARSNEVGVAGAALYPTVDVEFRERLQSRITPEPVIDTKRSTMIEVKYEFPTGGATISRKRQANERSQAAQATADATLLEAQSTLTQYWDGWEQARRIAPRLAEAVEAGRRLVDAYDLQFTAGRRTLNDLLLVRSSLLQSRRDLVDNDYTRLLNQANLLGLMGQLSTSVMTESSAPAIDKVADASH